MPSLSFVRGWSNVQSSRSIRGSQRFRTRASVPSELIAEGKAKYEKGDKMGALKLFEEASSRSEDLSVKRAALYNQCCCHTYFGDLELAQIALREAIQCGLDYGRVEEDPDLLRMEASAQVRNQLRSFASGRQASSGTRQRRDFERMKRTGERRSSAGSQMSGMLEDIETGDNIDVTVQGLLRRVVLVIVAFVLAFFLLLLLLKVYLGAAGLG